MNGIEKTNTISLSFTEVRMKTLFDPNIALVGKVMDMQLQRQNVLMSNIANVNTPHYRPRELFFEEELQKALNLGAQGMVTRTESAHIPSTFDVNTFSAQFDKKFTPRFVPGEDRVNLDKEMVKVNKNNLQYTTMAQLTKSSFEGIKTMIMEGSK